MFDASASEASIRPRLRSRGDTRSRPASGYRQYGGFNSATAAEPWRSTRGLPAPRPRSGSFNSATAAEPWRFDSMADLLDPTYTSFNSATAAEPWRCSVKSN